MSTRLAHGTAKYMWVLAIIAVSGLAGCSSSSGLSGSVTFDGQPLAEGTIQFRPADGTTGLGGSAKITNGSYSVPASEGMKPGNYSVAIMATRPATPAEMAQLGQEGDSTRGETQETDEEEGEAAAAAPASPVVQFIPAKYNTQTTLTVEVTAGANTKDFNLEK